MTENMEKAKKELARNNRLFDAVHEINRTTSKLQGIATVLLGDIADNLYTGSWTVNESVENLLFFVTKVMVSNGSDNERATKGLAVIKESIVKIIVILQWEYDNAFDDSAASDVGMTSADMMLKQGLLSAISEGSNLLSAFVVFEDEVNKYLKDFSNYNSAGPGGLYGSVASRGH